MGLLSIIRKVKRKEREMRVLLVGLDNAGKTTVLKKLNGEDVLTVSPTLGFQIKTLAFGGYTLNVWDVGGQKTLRSYWRNYFESTDGLIWVLDSADVRRMEDCAEELGKLLLEERLAGATLLIFANKQDTAGALHPDQVEDFLDVARVCEKRHWKVIGCSAVTGMGLEEGFQWLVDDIGSRIFLLD